MDSSIGKAFTALLRGLAAVGTAVAESCRAALGVIVRPVRRLAVRSGSRAVRALRRFVTVAKRYGVIKAAALTAYRAQRRLATHKQQLRRGFFRLAPMVLAAALLIGAVEYWTAFTLAYEVNYDGSNVGYVASEAVFADACELVSQQVVEDSFNAKDNVVYSLTIVTADAVNDAREVCENIIQVSDEIQPAVGLYVDGKLTAVCTDAARMEAAVNQVAEQYLTASEEGRLSFANDIQYIGGLYPAYKIRSTVSAQALSAVLTVMVTREETYTEAIPFDTTEVRDNRQYIGYRGVVSAGADGQKQITASVSYVNGRETDRQILTEQTVKEPVTQVVAVGTRQYTRSADADTGDTLLWPVVGAGVSNVSAYFGDGRNHKGIDICSPRGTPIVAAEAGVVTFVGWESGYGNYCIVKHAGSLSTVYAHCDSISAVVGQTVRRGDYLAAVGITGRAYAYHCHFEVRVNGVAVDARPYLGIN